MKKKLLRILAIVLFLVAGTMIGLRTWVSEWVSRGRLIAEMEKGWNCRADIASVSLSLFHFPALVQIRGLRLAPWNDEVTKPLDSRAPIDPAEVLLSAGTIDLTISLGDLIYRRAVIQRLHIEDFNLRDEEDVVAGGKKDEPHEGLLDLLFSSPDEFESVEVKPVPRNPKESASVPAGLNRARMGLFHSGMLAPATVAVTAVGVEVSQASPELARGSGEELAVKKRKKKRTKKDHEHKPFKASDLIMALAAEEVSVGNAHIDLLERRTVLDKDGGIAERRERRTVFDRVNVVLTDLDVAPDDLAKHNRCSLQLEGSITLDQKITAGEEPPVSKRLVCFDVTGSGFIRPFDAKSGEWDPDSTIKANIRKGAILGGVPLKEALRKKDMKKLGEWGIDFGEVSLGGVLGEDATADVHYYRGGKLIVKGDTRLVFPDYEVTLRDGSWFNTHEDEHRATCALLIGPALSKRLLSQVKMHVAETDVAKKFGGDLVGLAAEAAVKTALMDSAGRLGYKFISKGRLSKPVQEWDAEQLLDIKDILKDAVKDAGTNLLKGLFEK